MHTNARWYNGNLNRRHKAALCATLLCVGLIILLGGGVRYVFGIGLLGLGFSWALGSNSRLVHWLFTIVGLLLLISVALDGFLWRRNKPELLKDDAETIYLDEDLAKNTTPPHYQDYSDKREFTRDWAHYLKDTDTQRTQLANDENKLRTDEAEGLLHHLVEIDWGLITGGALLLSSGLGLIAGIQLPRKAYQGPNEH